MDLINIIKYIFIILIMILSLRFIIIEFSVYKVTQGKPEPISLMDINTYENIKKDIQIKILENDKKIRLKRTNTSHLFGLKYLESYNELDLSPLNKIIELNIEENYVKVGGNTNLAELIKYLQKEGYGLKVIPDMDHLTIGGLYAGIGGGARTFKCGAFFNIVKEVEIITGNGEILICNENENKDLFEFLPSTLGSLGYCLSLNLEIEPIKKYVFSRTYHYTNFKDFINNIKNNMENGDLDFLDGTIFSDTHFAVIIGKQTNDKSNYKLYGKDLGIPYDAMVEEGYIGIYEYYDYIYRWDVDGYYSFRSEDPIINMLRNKYVRKFLDKRLFRETELRNLGELFGKSCYDANGQITDCVGDFMIPISNADKYFDWFKHNGDECYPLYMCPIDFPTQSKFIKTDKLSIDFGIGYGVNPKGNYEKESYLRKCMLKAYDLGGDMLKYNSIYNNEEEFWSYYSIELREKYELLREKYDSKNRFYSITDKLII